MSPRALMQRVETLRDIDIPVGLGHLIDWDPLAIPAGFSLRTYDVNLDTREGVTQRGGIEYIAENGACGLQIATCQEGSGWDANSAADATAGRFRRFKYSVAGTSSRLLTAGAPGTVSSKLTINHLDLNSDPEEYICWWTYIVDVTKVTSIALIITSGEQEALSPEEYVVAPPTGFSGAAGSGSFTFRVLAANLVNGFNFFQVKKSAATRSGLPVWTDVTSATIELVATAATACNFDNIWLGPAHLYGLFNFRRSAAKGGGNWYLAAGRGQIDVFVPESQRWKPLVLGLVRDEPVNFFAFQDACYAVKKSDDVRLIVDNNTAYTSGIAAPPAPPTVGQVVVGGGSIAKGTHHVAVVFYSKITRREGPPVFLDDIVVAADSTRFDYTNLPASADPKVSHLRIYRWAPGRPGYKRVSAELEGEVLNGTPIYSEGTASASLGALLEGSPNYDINFAPGKRSIGAVVGNHVVWDDPANPGRISVGRPNTGEQVPLDGSVPLDEGDNDEITAIFNADGSAVVFKNNSFYVGPAVGGGNQPFAFVRKSEKIGSISHRGVIGSDDGEIKWPHGTGWYAMNYGWVPRKIASGWDKPSKVPLAEPSLKNLDISKGQLITSAYLTHRDQVYWTVTRKGQRIPNVQAVLHEELLAAPSGEPVGGWSFHRAPVSIIAQAFDASREEMVLAGGAAGIVFRFDTSRLHDRLVTGKVAIDMDYMTPPLDRLFATAGLGMGAVFEAKHLDMLMRPSGNWPLDYEVFSDWMPIEGASGQLQPDRKAGDPIGVAFAVGKSRIGGAGGSYQRGKLRDGRMSSAMVRLRNNRLDEGPYIGRAKMWIIARRSGASRY